MRMEGTEPSPSLNGGTGYYAKVRFCQTGRIFPINLWPVLKNTTKGAEWVGLAWNPQVFGMPSTKGCSLSWVPNFPLWMPWDKWPRAEPGLDEINWDELRRD